MRGAPLLLLALAAPGCRPAKAPAPVPSPAADAEIAAASDPEEKAGLAAARDDIDAKRRAELAAKRKEIERLKDENRKLREKAAGAR